MRGKERQTDKQTVAPLGYSKLGDIKISYFVKTFGFRLCKGSTKNVTEREVTYFPSKTTFQVQIAFTCVTDRPTD